MECGKALILVDITRFFLDFIYLQSNVFVWDFGELSSVIMLVFYFIHFYKIHNFYLIISSTHI